jgi:hypothetical protein
VSRLSLGDGVLLPARVCAYYAPDRGDTAFDMVLGPFTVATTEAAWMELRAAMDAAIATLPRQKQQHAETQRMLGMARAVARKQVTA